ncbi:phosphonoacetaldehyde reductase [Candidatus Woesearchaeota archaeon]|nr:phosphonoacetaldehyde reductase [Candidatus Woesearchaeota archaeon]
MPQQEYLGYNSIENLRNILSKHIPKSIFLVTHKDSYERCGAKSIIDSFLNSSNLAHFNDFEINPKIEDIERGINIFKKNNCDFVIAVGGGSAMDTAKSINLFANNPGNPMDYIQKKQIIENKGKTLAAIPTTSGSGSEATKFAVIYTEKIKQSLEHEFMLPDYAIVDPQFTMSLPKYVTACSGMDALSQGIESYWCVNSNEESKKYAKEAIKLVIKNLSAAVNNPSKESREAMSKAAHLAGKAINISKTTACHAVSYPITSYFNLPHGHAVALTLPSMLIYNSKVDENSLLDKRGIIYVKKTINEIIKFIDAKSADDAGKKLQNLMIGIGLSTQLGQLGIKTEDDVKLIIQRGFNPQRVNNNPRRLTEEALKEILEKIR